MPTRRLLLIVLLLASAACRDRPPARSRDSGQTTIHTTASRGDPVPWMPGVEPLLLVPSDSQHRALALFADTMLVLSDLPAPAMATFVRADGTHFVARMTLVEAAESCVAAVIDSAPGSAWGAGFVGGTVRALGSDSLRGMSREDSTMMTRMLYRLASSVPNDASGRFTGLPFTIVDLWRMKLTDGSAVVVGVTRRQINQEDSPLEERTFIVAESASGTPDSFVTGLARRSTGSEETIENLILLASARVADAPPYLVLEHDFGDVTAYSLVERSAGGRWSTRWMSRRISC